MSRTNYPIGWRDVTNLLSEKYKATDLGFKCSDGDLSRFAARYRLAKSFTGIDFTGYSKKTTNGYNGLFKVFLWYSVLEMLRLCINGKDEKTNRIKPLEKEKRQDIKLAEKVRKLDKKNFFNFITEKLDNRKSLDDFLSKKNNNLIIPATAIRHIFTHGHLTPNSKGTLPANTVKITNLLTDYLLEIIDDSFKEIYVKNIIWFNRFQQYKDDPAYIVIKRNHFIVFEPVPYEKIKNKNHFSFKKKGNTDIIFTQTIKCLGQHPEHLNKMFPDNAEWIDGDE